MVEYLPVHQVSNDTGPLGDAYNHCEKWQYFRVPGNSITSVHECTHGINAQLRTKYKASGFYLLNNQAMILPEPGTKKSDCIKYIPKEMRYGRYDMYVVGARDWESMPLYIFDEWTAYINGAVCMIHLDGREGLNTDYLFGPVEFAAYGLATAMAAPNRQDIKDFAVHLLDRTIKLYLQGRKKFPWADADKCYAQLQKNFPDFMDPPPVTGAIYSIPGGQLTVDYATKTITYPTGWSGRNA